MMLTSVTNRRRL